MAIEGWVLQLKKRRIEISLFLILPVLLMLFSFLPTYLTVQLFLPMFRASQMEMPAVVEQIAGRFQALVVAVLVFSIFIGLFVAYAILRPMRRLMTGMSKVARADLTDTIALQEADEFVRLSDHFNLMVTSLNRYIMESMAGGVMTVNRKGVITSFNTAAETIMGYDARHLIGRSISDLAREGKISREIVSLVEQATEAQQTCSSREVPLRALDGRPVSLGVTTSLLKDEADLLVGVVVSFKDLAEVKQLQEQMVRAERLASLGTLAAGVAHEVKTPLTSIRGLVQLMMDERRSDEERRHGEVILRELDRLNAVAQSLLTFAQPTPPQLQPTDLNQLLHRAVTLAGFEKGSKKVQITETYDPILPEVVVEGERLLQVFLNILLNAIQAISDEGAVRVRTHLRDGAWAIVEIGNTGPKIPSETLKRIFDPFYTTKAHGTGLGLAVANQIVTAHGGRIAVSSEEGDTTFALEFPLAGRLAASLPDAGARTA